MSLFKSLLLATVAATSAVAYTGDMTYFHQGLGSCGQTKSDSDAVVALSALDYGEWANPNEATVCGKWIKITASNGKTARAQVWDKCPGGECVSGGIDVSPSVFTQIADLSVGRLTVTWEYEDGTGGGGEVSTTAVPAPTSEAPVPTTTSEVVVPTTTSEVIVPTTTSEVVIPTTTSEVVVPTSTSEVVVPTSTSAVVVPSSTSSSSTSIAAPTTFSTRVRPSTTSQAAPSTTSLPGQVLVESKRVKLVVVTEWVTSTVTETALPTSS
ncbi:unnamed protein product [Clonostachys rosea]|uniref:RlpA-like protein double-psi beta-barrel domain-containing protein n=1 Tax=Bionectria ochroleuca TaxID=29856 RepID=A0ABY6UM57_BIOOC|nr:unnamed protein product [Clonostachys rosea]